MLRQYIGRTILATDFIEHDHLRLTFVDAVMIVSLRQDARKGPEALHLIPADDRGRVATANMSIW